MSVGIDVDADRMVTVASLVEGQCTAVGTMRTTLNTMGTDLEVWAWSGAARTALAEFVQDATNVANVLSVRAQLATIADHGPFSDSRYGHLTAELDKALVGLHSGLDDEVGATGSSDDMQRHLERAHLGVGGVPEMPDDVADEDVWHAVNVSGPTLAGASGDEATQYWEELSPEEQYALIVYATPTASDAHQAGAIDLDEAQLLALQSMPLGVWDRQPSSGPETDWAGVDLPPLSDEDEAAGVERGELRSFAGGSLVCSAIQVFSPIPSRPDTSTAARGAVSAVGLGKDANTAYEVVSNGTRGGKAISPATWFAAAADIGLCRLEVGSSDPISSDKVIDSHGNEVYETSRGQVSPGIGPEGVTVPSTFEERDRATWNREHLPPNGPWAPYPEDEFPVYPENDPASQGD